MTATVQSAAESGMSAELRKLLRAAHSRATAELGLSNRGDPLFGWRDRSIGTLVERAGELCWLRVVWSRKEWARGSWWTGNADADALEGVAKPQLLDVRERVEGPLMYRSELMTYEPGPPCSPTPDLHTPPDIGESWWDALEDSLKSLADASTSRTVVDPVAVIRRIAVFFGVELTTDVRAWIPSHGDLHWNNLQADPFAIVDWEAWGLAPRGYDAAFLLCHSLAVPEAAEGIGWRFRADLESDDGIVSQLYVMTKLLTRADGGEYLELVAPIHRHAERLLGRRSSNAHLSKESTHDRIGLF